MVYLMMPLLQISYWVCRWKNFENRSAFGEVTDKSVVAGIFWVAVYILLPYLMVRLVII